MTLIIVVTVPIAVVWMFCGMLVLGCVLNLRWRVLLPLVVLPIAALVVFGLMFLSLTGLQGYDAQTLLTAAVVCFMLPHPILVSLMVRRARRMARDGRTIVEEVFQ